MKQDHKLVSHEQDYELSYIIEKFKVPRDVLEGTMRSLGEDGKFERSRAKIYEALKELGYTTNHDENKVS